MSEGRLVALEGVEGAGKTTQADLLTEWLVDLGVRFTAAREPGGTEVGEAIREIVQDRPDLAVPAETELLLYLGSRAAFVREIVRPALDRGELVVADRYSMSTFAYQGYGRGLDLESVRRLDSFATGGLTPDVYLIFDLAAEDGLARQRHGDAGGDRIEREGDAFLKTVREGYLELAQTEPGAHLIDASGDAEAVHRRVREVLIEALPETFGVLGV
ncbi:MAG: dTMP kinase [Gemmatimonadota bacterium]|nr:MAG: dTMP kinase [Gemmatimonadota bacterium]